MEFTHKSYAKAREEYKSAPMHFSIARVLIDHKEPFIDAALHHLSMAVKVSLKLICLTQEISYEDREGFDSLFSKTRGFLPREILYMENSLLCWNGYTSTGVKTADEVVEAGKKCEWFFNEHIRKSLIAMSDTFKRVEFSKSEIFRAV